MASRAIAQIATSLCGYTKLLIDFPSRVCGCSRNAASTWAFPLRGDAEVKRCGSELRSAFRRDLLVRRRREKRDGQPLDARSLDFVDAEAHAVGLALVADPGGAPEHAEDEPGDRVVVLLRQLAAELLVEVVDGECPVDADRVVVDALDRFVRKVELVLDLADDLLEHVLERDDPLHAAVLVEDD